MDEHDLQFPLKGRGREICKISASFTTQLIHFPWFFWHPHLYFLWKRSVDCCLAEGPKKSPQVFPIICKWFPVLLLMISDLSHHSLNPKNDMFCVKRDIFPTPRSPQSLVAMPAWSRLPSQMSYCIARRNSNCNPGARQPGRLRIHQRRDSIAYVDAKKSGKVNPGIFFFIYWK